MISPPALQLGRRLRFFDFVDLEIQNIQSAVAGVKRINEFLSEPEREKTDASAPDKMAGWCQDPCIRFDQVSFSYDKESAVLSKRKKGLPI